MKKQGYAGKIANTSSQVVKAPQQIAPKKGKNVGKTGNDLRGGK